MATTPRTPRMPRDIERDDTAVVASDDSFADDTTRRATDEDADVLQDAPGDGAPALDDAAGSDDEDVAAESPRGTRRGR